MKDELNDYYISSEEITYNRNEQKLFTTGKTSSVIQNKYFVESENILFLIQSNHLSSKDKTIIKDDKSQVYYLDEFFYSIIFKR